MIPLVLAAVIGCQDNIPTSGTGPLEIRKPVFSAFPGSNGKLAYSSDLNGVQTINPDGTGWQALTSEGAGATWSADGGKIAFNSFADGNNEIYVMNADGSGRTQLTHTSDPTGLTFPSWSPDGSKIAFQNDLEGRIYVMNSDGSSITALTPAGGLDFGPEWSPDGTRIAFSKIVAGVPKVYVMNADGTNQTLLTTNVDSNYNPNWSPDGTRIIFTRQVNNPGELSDIYVMNADGTGVTNLTNTPSRAEATATWSPDGTKIGFIGNAGSNSDIYVMNSDGTGQTNITNSAANEFHLDWQSQHVSSVCVFGPRLYTRQQGGPQNIVENFTATPGSYIVDLDDLASAGADATVKLNGVTIMDGRGTTGEVGPRHYTVPVTLAANNVLQISLRGKKNSVLRVKVCPASVSQCYPDLAAPQLTLQSTTVEGDRVEFQLDIPNYAQFPDALFSPSPDLPACGLNTSASRSWVDIRDGDGNYLYGFCALYGASSLNDIWFATTVSNWPAEAYITITDRRCNITYTSNRINLAGIL